MDQEALDNSGGLEGDMMVQPATRVSQVNSGGLEGDMMVQPATRVSQIYFAQKNIFV